MSMCEYCCTLIHPEDLKAMPDDLPAGLPWSDKWDYMPYHSWCFERILEDEINNGDTKL